MLKQEILIQVLLSKCGVVTKMAWGKAGSTTLSSAGDNIDVTGFTDNKVIMYLNHNIPTGSMTDQLRFDGNSGSNYAFRYNNNGTSESTLTNQDNASYLGWTTNTNQSFSIGYIANISTEEKIGMNHSTDNHDGTGAGTAPNRRETVFKLADTTNSIDEVNIFNSHTGSFDTGSNLTVLGSDLTPTAAVPAIDNVQDNSLFVEKENGRRYWFDGTTWLLGKSHISKSGCLIYYNFEQTSGNLINQATTANGFTDGLGSTGDGTSSGTVGKSNTGKVGSNAWSFDGSSGKTASSNSSDLILTGDTSWVGWIKIDSSTSTGAPTIFSVRGGATNNQVDNALFCGYVSQNTSPVDLIVFHEHDAGTNISPSVNINSNLSTGVWHHFAVTRDVSEKQYSVYVNGSLLSTHTYNTNPNTTATSLDFELGHAVSDDYFDGMLDEVSLWNRVLTADEISALYNSGYGAVI